MHIPFEYLNREGSIDAQYTVVVTEESGISEGNLTEVMQKAIDGNNGILPGLADYPVQGINEIGEIQCKQKHGLEMNNMNMNKKNVIVVLKLQKGSYVYLLLKFT